MRPGYGQRHPEVETLLSGRSPVLTEDVAWADGTLRLRMSAYTSISALPDAFVTSVRCVVLVDDRVVVCENLDGCHPWPGGRREAGESHVETACREVLEETGWRLEPESLREIGWLHVEFLDPFPEDHPYPHPDILQVVYTGRAVERDEAEGVEWTDTDGWELASRLSTIEDALGRPCLVASSAPFLELVRDLGSGPGR